MSNTDYDKSDVRTALNNADELYRFRGQMLAECPFTGEFGFLNVLGIPASNNSQFSGRFVYVSDAGVNELEAHGVGFTNMECSFKEVVEGEAEIEE
jgi:hypothetical protein